MLGKVDRAAAIANATQMQFLSVSEPAEPLIISKNDRSNERHAIFVLAVFSMCRRVVRISVESWP